jgi:hypothetical protein
LRIEGNVGWEFDYHLPALWPWLFDPESITESRRLHATAFAAAENFQRCRSRLANLPWLQELTGILERIEPENFARDLNTHPDAVISLDLMLFENERPYVHETAADRWEQFFRAAERGDRRGALEFWQQATLNPLVLYGSRQQDARALSARAQEFGYDREDRGRALVTCLFGRPVSRPAMALAHRWTEAAQRLEAVGYREKKPWWARMTGM